MGSMAEFQGSLPPHAIEAEASLLGGLLLDNRVWEHVSDVVVDSDFYRYEHRLIYAAVAKLITASRLNSSVRPRHTTSAVGARRR